MRLRLALLATLATAALASSARADWEDGRVPEGGDNAYTLGRHQLRVPILGATTFGLSSRVELSTYAPLDLVLFPNLAVKWRFHETDTTAVAAKLGAGGGIYPIVGGAIIPYPPTGAGFFGFVAAGTQKLDLTASTRTSRMLTLSATAGAFAVELGVIAIAGAASFAGYVPLVLPLSGGGAAPGATGGVELDYRIDKRDVFVFDLNVWFVRGAKDGLLMSTAAFTHAWGTFHLTIGAYTLADVPDTTIWKQSKLPVAPYANVSWTFF